MALKRVLLGKGGGATRSWTFLIGVALALLLLSIPVGAESPCDSPTVIPEAQEVLRSDCGALWEFYTNLDDPGVLDDADNPNAWSSTTPFGEWQGVDVRTNRVFILILSDLQLKGPISPSLGRLTSLLGLHLDRNQLTGSVPPELGRLSNLRGLLLNSNELTGSVPPELGRLTDLGGLFLHDNQLTGSIPPELGQLANLASLVLHSNRLTGPIPPELGELSKLTFLELGGNSFTGSIPPELGKLAELTYLVIHSSGLTGPIPPQIGDLTNLKQLHLYNNKLSGSIPGDLGRLAKLEVLDLSRNQLSGSIPAGLGKLADLTILYLNANGLTGSIPSELGDLAELEKLRLGGNELTGPIPPALVDLIDPDTRARIDPFAADPLGLIAHADVYREFSLGAEVWDVWLCDVLIGDVTLTSTKIISSLKRQIALYFRWLSNDRYRPEFVYKGDVAADDRGACERAARSTPTSHRLLVIDDTAYGGGYASDGAIVVGGAAVATAPGWSEPILATVSHEIGHALGFPHSYGGKIRWSNGEVYEGDNPMDLVSGQVRIDLNTATIAVNRYAAGWIDPENVVIHEAGTTEVYELRPPGLGGLQMLVLPGNRPGVFTTLGARIGVGYDLAIPKQGVEVYRIDQRPSACKYPSRGACWGTDRRTKPHPAAPQGAGHGEHLYGRRKARLTQHVHGTGDVFEVGQVSVEVVERVGNYYTVKVVDSSTPTPPPEVTFAGRFSDDDGNVHEANIEIMAELGITLGCNPPDNDRYCPTTVVARAQMMAFLARALGEEGNPEITTSRFSDVPDGAWYLPYLEQLADLGVVEPYEDGTFRPYQPVTRLDMAVFLTRAFSHITEVSPPEGVFSDVPADAPGAGAVEAIRAAGVTKGCSTEPFSYCPDKPVPRDQMASFLARALAAEPGGSETSG